MKLIQILIYVGALLVGTAYAVTINLTSVPEYPQPWVPPASESVKDKPSKKTSDKPSKEMWGGAVKTKHTIYFPEIDEAPEYEVSKTVAFPLDKGISSKGSSATSTDFVLSSEVLAATSTAISNLEATTANTPLSCKPVEIGDIETKIKAATVFLDDDFITPIAFHDYIAPWLPPDPGTMGKTTIAGIDTDGDCVRDDVERYIVKMYPGNGDADKRKYLFEYAKWLGVQLQSSINESTAKSIFNNLAVAGECVNRNLGDSASAEAIDGLFAKFHNTFSRSFRYIDNLSQTSGWTTREDISISCP